MAGKDWYEEPYLFHIYCQTRGNLTQMMKYEDVPKSLNTLRRYRDQYGWKQRLEKELAKRAAKFQEVRDTQSMARIEKLRYLEKVLFENLLPQKNKKTGEMEYVLRPSHWESSAGVLMKVIEKIELLSGNPTSRTEVRSIIDVNVRQVVILVGDVINALLKEGVLNEEQARQFLQRFQAGSKTLEYRDQPGAEPDRGILDPGADPPRDAGPDDLPEDERDG